MLKELNWSTLEERWKASRLTLLSRIFHHQEPAIQLPHYFLPQTSTTRQFHQLSFIITYIKHPATLPSLHPATLHFQVYQICFFSVSDTETYIYAVNNIDILHIIACKLC